MVYQGFQALKARKEHPALQELKDRRVFQVTRFA
jgi:hypothetical protein